MKGVKLVALFMVSVLIAGAVYLLVVERGSRDLLLINGSAAVIEGVDRQIGVFLKIENSGGPDRLIGARSDAAQSAGLSHGAPPGGLAIPAGSSPSLAPDGAFVLLNGVTGELGEGRIIPVTLEFENAGGISTRVRLAAPRDSGEASHFGLFGIGDICRVGEGEPAPQIGIDVKPDGDGWIVEVAAENFTFSKDLADGPHIPGTGHGHLYLDGLKLQRLYEPRARIGALPHGSAMMTVTLNTNDHRSYVVGEDPVTAKAVIPPS